MNAAGSSITIGDRQIGAGQPAYIIAEMSANHQQDFAKAIEILHAMKESGADAVKLQTYTPDTMTIKCDKPEFMIGKDTIWAGKTLYELYEEAYTPWEWQPKLKEKAEELGMHLFSTPFDTTSTDFLEKMNVPAYKIASFEANDLPLIEHIAKKGKPIILSTGMAAKEEIQEAVDVIHAAGNTELILLKCTSAYPCPPEEMNLRTIEYMQKSFNVPIGLSDHTLGIAVPVAAVALGACVIEKHFCMTRDEPGVDSAFSLEPQEFTEMVDAVRTVEKALGTVSYTLTEKEKATAVFRRSLFAVEDIAAGEEFTSTNVRSIRPAHGLPPKQISDILGKKARKAIERGTPLSDELIA